MICGGGQIVFIGVHHTETAGINRHAVLLLAVLSYFPSLVQPIEGVVKNQGYYRTSAPGS